MYHARRNCNLLSKRILEKNFWNSISFAVEKIAENICIEQKRLYE